MPAGRPLKYKTEEELQTAIDEYFKLNRSSPTISGLALHLGFDSRKTFYNYQERPEFLHTLKKARTRIEDVHEKRLFEQSCTGSIFYLKNVGWTAEENKKVEHGGSLKFDGIVISDE